MPDSRNLAAFPRIGGSVADVAFTRSRLRALDLGGSNLWECSANRASVEVQRLYKRTRERGRGFLRELTGLVDHAFARFLGGQGRNDGSCRVQLGTPAPG